jgi:hypothetical protein
MSQKNEQIVLYSRKFSYDGQIRERPPWAMDRLFGSKERLKQNGETK